MKPILTYLLTLLLVAPAIGFGQQDPFKSSDKAAWHLESIEEKPYLLEIAYGEIESSLPDEPFEVKIEVDPDFLSSAIVLSVAVSFNETGELNEKGRHMVKYQVTENASGSFDLNLYLKTLQGGLRETNTEITLNLSDWIIIGGLTRSADDGTPRSYVTAIRITPRANKTE